MGLRDFGLYHVIECNARVHRERAAVVADGRRIAHGEYASAAALAGEGQGHIDRARVKQEVANG